jgi:hypothetical protein
MVLESIGKTPARIMPIREYDELIIILATYSLEGRDALEF